jgi:hypothetical protein
MLRFARRARACAMRRRCILTSVRRASSIWRLSHFIQDAHQVSDETLPGFLFLSPWLGQATCQYDKLRDNFYPFSVADGIIEGEYKISDFKHRFDI